MIKCGLQTLANKIHFQSCCVLDIKIYELYSVCHGFRFTNQDDYFRVTFDHF